MLNKAQLAANIAANRGITKKAAEDAVNAVFEALGDTVARGEEVRIAGFGEFKAHAIGARAGRNPKTGTSVTIAPRKRVSFSAGSTLRRKVNSY